MVITLAQMNSVIGDFAGNARKIVEMAKQAISMSQKNSVPSLIVFPELSLCGYPPMDLLDQEAFVEGSLAALRSLQKELPPALAVAVGYVDKNRTGSGRAYVNAMSVIADGRVVFTQAKTLLPTYDVFDEARYFEPAKTRNVFTPSGCRIGFAICEDFWWESPPSASVKYAVDPVKDLLDAGIDLLIVPSASPFVAGKLRTRLALARGTAREGRIPVLYCNAVGANDSLVFDGRSFVVNPEGKPIAMCGWGESFLSIDTDSLEARAFPDASDPAASGDSVEEIRQALIVGIRDYLCKTGFNQACIGLSGGIDSAVVAVLAAEAIGAENVTCIALPSRFSSQGSLDDAIELCGRTGMHLEKFSIESPFTAYLNLLSGAFAGKPFDLAEENLQARIRGTLLMAWSNKFNSLLLTTGNKSELAAGYCTLYGDMCGALAVIGDLYKTEVYALAKRLNALAAEAGKAEPIPQPIIDKAPSAELRLNQKDQDSLPEYFILDGILKEYIEGDQTLEDIVAKGYDRAVVEKVLKMTARAEYKRRQAAPAIKVSKRAFGIGRRLPLARHIHETEG